MRVTVIDVNDYVPMITSNFTVNVRIRAECTRFLAGAVKVMQ